MSGPRPWAVACGAAGVLVVGGCSGDASTSAEQRATGEAVAAARHFLVEVQDAHRSVTEVPHAPAPGVVRDVVVAAVERQDTAPWVERQDESADGGTWIVAFAGSATSDTVFWAGASVRLCTELTVDVTRDPAVVLTDGACPPHAERLAVDEVDVDLPEDR